MTTKAQIRKLVKPLLARHPDLVAIDDWIILKPVRHVIRAVTIDRCGEARRFRPTWAVVDIVEPLKMMTLNWGEMFGHPTRSLWYWDDPTIQDALIEVMEAEVLPLIRSIQTLDDFVSFGCQERFRLGEFNAFLLRYAPVEVARGNLESALSICAKLASGKTQWSQVAYRQKYDQVMQLYPLLQADDRPGLVRLLREFEAYSVKNLHLESVWEKTPFPLERIATEGLRQRKSST
jgi:hypothetical protein